MLHRPTVPIVPVLCLAAGVALGAMLPRADDVARWARSLRDRHPSASGRFPGQLERYRPDDTTVSKCEHRAPDVACYEQALANLANRRGARPALRLLASHVGSGDMLDGTCHRLTHAVGTGALHRNHGEIATTLAEGDATCWSGYYHGVLERALSDVPPNVGAMASAARNMCSSRQVRATAFLHYQCLHGLGHGLMLHTNYELMTSLKVCERIPTASDSSACDGGAFMENIATSRGQHSKYLRDDDLIYPCNAVSERHKLYCYLMVTSRINERNGYDFAATARVCLTRAEQRWVPTCFQSQGRDASGNARRHVDPVVRSCRSAGRYEADCVAGAARDMTGEDHGTRRVSRFCMLEQPELRGGCFQAVGSIVGDIDPSTPGRTRICGAGVPARFMDACLSGAATRDSMRP